MPLNERWIRVPLPPPPSLDPFRSSSCGQERQAWLHLLVGNADYRNKGRPRINRSTTKTTQSIRAARRFRRLLGGARFVFRSGRRGLRDSPPNYWRFPGVATIRSTPSPRASRGVAARRVAKARLASSRFTKLVARRRNRLSLAWLWSATSFRSVKVKNQKPE
jgi:hypothetical protein